MSEISLPTMFEPDAIRAIHIAALLNGDELFATTAQDSVYSFMVTNELSEKGLGANGAETRAEEAAAVGGLLKRYSGHAPLGHNGIPWLGDHLSIERGTPVRVCAEQIRLGENLFFGEPEDTIGGLQTPLMRTSVVKSLKLLKGERHQALDDLALSKRLGRLGLDRRINAVKSYIDYL